MTTQDRLDSITAKEAEITNYTRILAAYAARGGGRWYDQGRRHLESLRAELHALKSQLDGELHHPIGSVNTS